MSGRKKGITLEKTIELINKTQLLNEDNIEKLADGKFLFEIINRLDALFSNPTGTKTLSLDELSDHRIRAYIYENLSKNTKTRTGILIKDIFMLFNQANDNIRQLYKDLNVDDNPSNAYLIRAMNRELKRDKQHPSNQHCLLLY